MCACVRERQRDRETETETETEAESETDRPLMMAGRLSGAVSTPMSPKSNTFRGFVDVGLAPTSGNVWKEKTSELSPFVATE